MKILTPGHKYELENFENKDNLGQIIQFIEKTPIFDAEPGKDPEPTGELKTVSDGTTNEEVLEVLINRLNYLNNKFPCRENSIAITHIETALLWLNKRTQDRLKRGVEGKHTK